MAKSRASDARSCQEEQKRSNKRDTTDVPGKHQGAAEARGQGAGSARQNQVNEQEKNRTRNVRESGEETGGMGAETERRELLKR